jgi:gliding motility-associated-like protein
LVRDAVLYEKEPEWQEASIHSKALSRLKTLLKFLFIVSILFYDQNTEAQVQPNYPTDCVDSVIICGNSSINLNVNGIGTPELNNSNSCSSEENNSIWLQVSLVTAGTFGFTLRPNSSSIQEDYDFFVFGPNVSCGNIGQAIRCSTTNPAAANQNNNFTGMRSGAGDTSEGPGPDGNSFVEWLDVAAGDTYFIVIDRPIGNSPFTLEWTGTAEFSSPPVNEADPIVPLDLELCDTVFPYEDGFINFNFDDSTARIRGTQSDVTISYHASISDANINYNPLASTYTNISNPQKIFARITNDITGCFEIVDFSLIVNLGPSFQPPAPFVECDTNIDGNSSNGQTLFDLESINPEILNGQDPASIEITYHLTQASAEADSGALPSPYYNTTPNQQQLFVRIEDAADSNCRAISTLDLLVDPLPDAFDSSIIQCDEDGITDGLTIFNLNEAKNTITGGASDRTLSYYLNSFDLLNGNEIDGSAFSNTINPQQLLVKVTNDLTNCFSVAQLKLEVSTTSANNDELKHCDNDGMEDGFYVFTLSDADPQVLSSLPIGLDLEYYESYEHALLELNPLPNSFKNTTAYSQTIYARVENSNACYGISEVKLTVFKMPNVELEAEAIYCLNNFPQPIIIDGGVIGDAPSNYSYSWSTGESTSEIMVNAAGTYTVRVTNINDCFKDRTVVVLPSNIATINNIDINDGSQNNTVTVMVTGEGEYDYALDAITGPYQEATTFDNVAPGFHTVFVRDMNGCGVSEKLISVIGFPKYFTPNNDGFNDYWQIYGINEQFQAKSTIYIFDRMGKLLKELNPLNLGWDGTYIGKQLAPDDYWFSVTLQDGRTLKGHFTLKR